MEETIYLVDEEEDGEEVRTAKKNSEMLFVRGMLSLFTFSIHCLMGEQEKEGKGKKGEKRRARGSGGRRVPSAPRIHFLTLSPFFCCSSGLSFSLSHRHASLKYGEERTKWV